MSQGQSIGIFSVVQHASIYKHNGLLTRYPDCSHTVSGCSVNMIRKNGLNCGAAQQSAALKLSTKFGIQSVSDKQPMANKSSQSNDTNSTILKSVLPIQANPNSTKLIRPNELGTSKLEERKGERRFSANKSSI